jgi:hypothetical protein
MLLGYKAVPPFTAKRGTQRNRLEKEKCPKQRRMQLENLDWVQIRLN